MLYVSLLIFPLRNLGMTLAFGQRAAVALKRVNEVLSTVPEVADPAAPRVLPARSTSRGTHGQHVGAVHFEHVSFAYGDDALVLDDFDLVIAAGSSVALVGSTASGKSTAARLLVRFYDVDRGTVSIDGIDVRDLRLGDLRRAVSVVFEDTFLFHDTVAANIAFAEPEAPQEVIERAARLAGAHEFILELPDGYSTLLGERGFSLSGGQRQRIALARAILADPRVLILDDATSAVDPSKEHEIREAMATVMRGRTTIVIAHRAGTIALADTVVLIDCGRVAAHGPHQHLLDTSERYRSVLAALVADDEDDADATAGALDVAR
jgi:ATP-binding cassette subfamily B protein